MGTSKRYADAVDRQMDARIAQRIMSGGPPASLGRAELQLDQLALTRTPKPIPVRVWVRYPEAPLEVDAEAVAWTSRAVAVRWPGPDGEHRAWVWASAVTPREIRNRPNTV